MPSNLRIISDHYAASTRGDLAGMLADVAPNARWTEMAGFPCAGTYTGPAEVVENVFKVLGTQWEGYRFELERLVDGGDRIVAIGTYAGTFRATGKSMRARAVHVWQLADGHITGFEQFCDTLLVAQAMQDGAR
jgi:ketosteroid isomerase-like protein